MFTGIIQAIGKIVNIQKNSTDCQFQIEIGSLNRQKLAIGDSVSVNGVCLTAVKFLDNSFYADVSNETLEKTTFKYLQLNQIVNLEPALTLSTPLGGHMVSGHVDGVGTVVDVKNDGISVRYKINVPTEINHYIAKKGSICIDGISLTVNEIQESLVFVNIVPHTLQATNMKNLKIGDRVNVEVDLIARYIERLLTKENQDSKINKQFLMENGFIK